MAAAGDAHELTRVVLTNLHPSVDAHHLRAHLERCPPTTPVITDLKVLSRPDGSSRCIAFAGFHSHDDADRVRKWASGAWLAGARGGARVKTDWAKSVRPSAVPRAPLPRHADFSALPACRRARPLAPQSVQGSLVLALTANRRRRAKRRTVSPSSSPS